MEAYKLFIDDIIRQIGSKKSAITVGWLNSVIFGVSAAVLGVFAFLGILGFDTPLKSS